MVCDVDLLAAAAQLYLYSVIEIVAYHHHLLRPIVEHAFHVFSLEAFKDGRELVFGMQI
jgi:hypothetical protein